MTGNDNPYAGSFGNQMTASASFGGGRPRPPHRAAT